MTEVIGVRFKKVGKVYYFSPEGLNINKGDHVIVETARGVEYGEAVMPNRMVDDDKIVKPLRNILRIATEADKKTVEENEKKENEAFDICQKKVAEHKLDMHLVTVEYTFDRNKVLFYFTADGRVDFRELVKDLASVFRTRIELRQIGVRDEAKMIGGLGVCGKPLCCATFLDDFQPVSINMAKEQNLSLNPAKISGTCGRLMCCLKYEQEAYDDMIRTTPSVDSVVETPQGPGTVIDVSLLKGICKVRLDNSPDSPKCYGKCDCKLLKDARGKRECPKAASKTEDQEILPEDLDILTKE
ncbi:MAG: stage 0 sporulation family protein [Bacillota bacterium]|nr:stage 0 sporulation family protein [Bacillota bacterium]